MQEPSAPRRGAGGVARNLETALGVVHRLLQPHIEPQPSRLEILVYLYARRSSFDAMRAELPELEVAYDTDFAELREPFLAYVKKF